MTLNEARHESAQRDATMKAQIETQIEVMKQEQQRQMKVMAKRQTDMEQQIRQFMQGFYGNQELEDEENEDNS